MNGMSADDFVSKLESILQDESDEGEGGRSNAIDDDFIPMPTGSASVSSANKGYPKRKRKPPSKYKEPIDEDDLLEMDDMFEKRTKGSSNNVLVSLQYKGLNDDKQIDDFYDTSCDELEHQIDESLTKKRRRDDFYDMDDLSDEEGEEATALKKITSLSKSKRHYVYNCFACAFGNARQSSINGDYANECARIIEENYGKVSNFYLGKMVHEYYKRVVYEPMTKLGYYPMWRTRTIVEHIEQHIFDPRIFLGESIKRLTRDIKDLSGMRKVVQEKFDGTKITTVDVKIHKAYLDTHLTALKFFQTPVEKLNFYNKESAIDPSYMGKMFTVNHKWELAKRVKR
jgi:hypothetical protein